jgi:hypothetical protein
VTVSAGAERTLRPLLSRPRHYRSVAIGETLPFQSTIGLSITARCPIACDHCIVEAGRHRTEEMSPEIACATLEACARYKSGSDRDDRIGAVIITGGEPFFAPALLRTILGCAVRLQLVPVVVTNAFWARTEQSALQTLRALPEIAMLTFSTDRFHQKFISLAKVRNAISAARRLAIPFNVAACADSPAELEMVERQLAESVEPHLILPAITLPAGRRARAPGPAPLPEAASAMARCTGAEAPVVFPDGRVMGCMGIVSGLPSGHPLLLGNVHEKPLSDLLAAAEDNVFLHAMRALGPSGVMGDGPGEPVVRLPERYRAHGKCALCYAMADSPDLLDQVSDRLTQPDLVERVAYARLYCLGEDWMARQIAGGEVARERAVDDCDAETTAVAERLHE